MADYQDVDGVAQIHRMERLVMDPNQQRLRGRTRTIWRIINPITCWFAGFVPWWVLLETTGRRTGQQRRTPIAAGVRDATGMWLIAAHGPHAHFVANIVSDPNVRMRDRGRWRNGTGSIRDLDEATVARFNGYARGALKLGIDPCLVRVEYAID